ncbi:heterokaryon incompatibility protein-domain-containing protein, partial [Sordaria brevicollis]
YIALSYEWGPEDNIHDPTILINGTHRLSIRKNLYEALKEFRASAEFSGKLLWVDAICINQQKAHGEKPHQIRLMGKIFGHAATVIAWLGTSAEDSDKAINALKACSQYGYLPKDRCFIRSVLQPPKPDQPLYTYPPWVTMKAITALCNRSYWRRVWIMQEIQQSQSLLVKCGSQSITGTELERAFEALQSFECIPHLRYEERSMKRYYRGLTKFLCLMAASVPLQHLRARKEVHMSLGQLLQICVEGGFQSTERRDYIFALLGMSNDVTEGAIRVDYKKPLWLLRNEALPVIERSY